VEIPAPVKEMACLLLTKSSAALLINSFIFLQKKTAGGEALKDPHAEDST